MFLTIERKDGTQVTHFVEDFGVTKNNIWYRIVGSHTVQQRLDGCTYRLSSTRP